MKPVRFFLILAFLLITGCLEYEIKPIGGQVKSAVMADGKTWTIHNLYLVPPGLENETWWYVDPRITDRSYGRLYTWRAAQATCKLLGDEWRLPTREDWHELGAACGEWKPWYGGLSFNYGAYERLISPADDVDAVENDFNGRLGGLLRATGEFQELQNLGLYWSASDKDDDTAWLLTFYPEGENIHWRFGEKSWGFSCRCVKD